MRAFRQVQTGAIELAQSQSIKSYELFWALIFRNLALRQRLVDRGFKPQTLEIPAVLGGGGKTQIVL